MWLWFYAWVVPCIIAYAFLSWIRRWIRIDNISHKHVLVTGCDVGLGNLLAQRLDMIGFRVYAGCTSDSARTRLQQVCSVRLKTLMLDVTSDDDVRTAFENVRANIPENEEFWAVVNNTETIGRILGPIEWHTANDFAEVLETNVLGVVRVTNAFLPLLKKSHGRVINMSSMGGRVPSTICLPYCSSKAALESLSDGLRQHLQQYHVTVHVVEPCLFRTDIVEKQPLRRAIELGWKGTTWQTKNEFGDTYFNNISSMVGDMTSWSSLDSQRGVNAYVHALTSRCPRMRYSVGWLAKFWYVPLSYAPSLVADFISSRVLSKLVPISLTEGAHQTYHLGTYNENTQS